MNILPIMCIYKIRNITNNHCYIGSAVNLRRRINTHFRKLKCGTHHSLALQRAYEKYGKDKFEVVILEEIKESELLIVSEQKWLDSEKPTYNMTLIAGKNCHLGVKRSQETKDKIRRSHLGIPMSEERKEKIRQTLTGRKQSSKTKQKRSETLKHSEKFQKAVQSKTRNNKIRATRINRGGYIVSDEQREQIRQTLKARNQATAISKRIIQYDLSGNIVNIFRSMKAASESQGFTPGRISNTLKLGRSLIGGFIWKEEKNEEG